jgi:hypothetical protein
MAALGGLAIAQEAARDKPDTALAAFEEVLTSYVNEDGMVDYAALKENTAELDRYLDSLDALPRSTYEAWPDDRKIAMWINAYNAYTLKVIINNYPIESGFFTSFVYPENSIRQIDGVWKEKTWGVMGEEITLDHMEHGVLRVDFNEPRIHAALVCAAMSCPPLRREPFTGADLDAQLDDQMRAWIRSPKGARIDRDGGVVRLSSIFKWFGKDFVEEHGDADIPGLNRTESAVITAVSRYVSDEDAAWLMNGGYDIKYLDYDWSLNEQ